MGRKFRSRCTQRQRLSARTHPCARTHTHTYTPTSAVTQKPTRPRYTGRNCCKQRHRPDQQWGPSGRGPTRNMCRGTPTPHTLDAMPTVRLAGSSPVGANTRVPGVRRFHSHWAATEVCAASTAASVAGVAGEPAPPEVCTRTATPRSGRTRLPHAPAHTHTHVPYSPRELNMHTSQPHQAITHIHTQNLLH
jgi:hypothetical protein